MSIITEHFTGYEIGARNGRQQSVLQWADEAFNTSGDKVETSPRVRMLRLVEECAELAQAEGLSVQDIAHVVSVVYGRPVGEHNQEVGGVIVTLMAYCEAKRISLVAAEMQEIARINNKSLDHFKQRQREKTAQGLL